MGGGALTESEWDGWGVSSAADVKKVQWKIKEEESQNKSRTGAKTANYSLTSAGKYRQDMPDTERVHYMFSALHQQNNLR